MYPRIQDLISQLARLHLDAYLVTNDINIQYLTHFPASESWLLISPPRSYYITDFRYMHEAEKGLKGISVHKYNQSLMETIFRICLRRSIKSLGFDDRHLTLAQFKKLKQGAPPGIRLQAKNHIIESMREVKTREEIELIRKALQINLKAFQFIQKYIRPGVSENQVLEKLERFVKFHKVKFSFNPIVASGPHSSYPHAQVTDRKIKNHEPVLIDMGIDREGYKSDLTRMFFLGKIPRLLHEINTLVASAQKKAIQKNQGQRKSLNGRSSGSQLSCTT